MFGVYDGGTYGALERVNDHVPSPPEHQVRQRLWRIVAKRCVVAAGAIERPIVFPGNDTPGVMMASAVRTYVQRYAATPARRLALFTNNEDGWRTVETALASRIAGRRRDRCARRTSPPPIARSRPRPAFPCCTAR